MLHPSYSDLMKVVNSEVEPGEAPVVNSRYSIVMANVEKGRGQIISGEGTDDRRKREKTFIRCSRGAESGKNKNIERRGSARTGRGSSCC